MLGALVLRIEGRWNWKLLGAKARRMFPKAPPCPAQEPGSTTYIRYLTLSNPKVKCWPCGTVLYNTIHTFSLDTLPFQSLPFDVSHSFPLLPCLNHFAHISLVPLSFLPSLQKLSHMQSDPGKCLAALSRTFGLSSSGRSYPRTVSLDPALQTQTEVSPLGCSQHARPLFSSFI
jgi:hypothetical protein